MKKDGTSLQTTNRLLVVCIVLIVINIFVTILVNGEKTKQSLYDNEMDISMFTSISLKDLTSHIEEDTYKVLVIGKPNCNYTLKMLPILERAQKEYGYETLYVDLREIDKEDEDALLEYDDESHFIEEYMGTTPFVIVFKNNQMIDTWVGYQDYLVFSKFLEEIGIEKIEN